MRPSAKRIFGGFQSGDSLDCIEAIAERIAVLDPLSLHVRDNRRIATRESVGGIEELDCSGEILLGCVMNLEPCRPVQPLVRLYGCLLTLPAVDPIERFTGSERNQRYESVEEQVYAKQERTPTIVS